MNSAEAPLGDVQNEVQMKTVGLSVVPKSHILCSISVDAEQQTYRESWDIV